MNMVLIPASPVTTAACGLPSGVRQSGVGIPGIEDYAAYLPTHCRDGVEVDPSSTFWRWRGHEVRVLRRTARDAPVRMLLVHGGGGHAAALWPIASLVPGHLADLAAVDMPLYGETRSADPGSVRYDDWVEMLCDFVAEHDDGRPLVLLGASMGGLLAHEVAARTGRAAAVVATCLLDPRDWRARTVLTRFGPLGLLGGVASRLLPKALAHRRIPMTWVAALSKMSRNPDLSQVCTVDPRGGGVHVPLGFLTSFMGYRHTPPERMNTPVTLAHPAKDAWTPMEISTRWLRRSPHHPTWWCSASADTSPWRIRVSGTSSRPSPGWSTVR